MIYYCLIPSEKVFVHGRPLIRPKYLHGFKINWVGVFLEKKNFFLIKINTRFAQKLDRLLTKKDVFPLEGTRTTREKVNETFNFDITENQDLINEVGKKQDKKFDKNKLFIHID